ncbi:DUF1697 domain-containing protein [Sphingomonas sp. GC_Shp_1]|uniref:DUF1697 domain-containing protein n=1 Tax=unclassified Sphingomonas TaxID=196159 RepID=UPI00226A1D1E
MRWAALLRGVNVGGNRKLAMADLAAFMRAEGYGGVATLLASGNVVFDADEDNAAALETRLAAAARARLGLDTDWLLRRHAELAAVIANNPFPDAAAARPNHLLVTFHRDPVPAALVAAVPLAGPERLHAAGRELYVDYAAGVGRSTLPATMAKLKFPRVATARNWNTVTKLAALTA